MPELLHHPDSHKLGKLEPKLDDRTLRLASYLEAGLPVPETWTLPHRPNRFPMYLNNQLGDCTCATAGHKIGMWHVGATGKAVWITDNAVLKAYEAVSGYDPRTGENDNGAVELDVLNYWRRTGVGGHKIGAYVSVDPRNIDHVKIADKMFGGLYVGAGLPVAAQSQDVWDIGPGGDLSGDYEPGSWGGHAFGTFGHGHGTQARSEGVRIGTWGRLKLVTWAWWVTYVDECYALVSLDWLSAGKSPDGLNLAQLNADLHRVAG